MSNLSVQSQSKIAKPFIYKDVAVAQIVSSRIDWNWINTLLKRVSIQKNIQFLAA